MNSSLIIGLIANLLWIPVIVPQLYTNWRLKSTDGLSMGLIGIWIYADLLTIISGVFKQSNQIVIYSSIYHIGLVSILGGQVCYYNPVSKRDVFFIVSSFMTLIPIGLLPGAADITATGSIILFTVSRIPQIILNWRRKSVHGLSIISFVIINVSNYLMLASILVDIRSYIDLMKNIQWIISPFLTSMLDTIILFQFYHYTNYGQVNNRSDG